jgi:DNA-directed RNA polymerase delta subunit
MDPLSSLDGIAELIRRRASEASSNNLDKNLSVKLSQTRQKHVVAKEKTAESVKLKIVDAIKAINDEDAKKDQKIVGIFVENVLLWQFGEDLINDPNFINLVDEVGAALLKERTYLDQLNKLAAL